MKRFVPYLLLLLLIVMAWIQRPTLAYHRDWIVQHAAQTAGIAPAPAADSLPLLDYVDYALITATRDPQTQKLISWGFGNYIKVVDPVWGQNALAGRPQ